MKFTHPRGWHTITAPKYNCKLDGQRLDQRWGCETDNVYLKTRLGLSDFRVRPYQAVDKYVAGCTWRWPTCSGA